MTCINHPEDCIRIVPREPSPEQERLAARIVGRLEFVTHPDPRAGFCAVWIGATDKDGYGLIKDHDGQRHLVHRAVVEFVIGQPLPDGVIVHHVCGNRLCCDPRHLDLLSPSAHSRTHHWLRNRDDQEAPVEIAPDDAGWSAYVHGAGAHTRGERR